MGSSAHEKISPTHTHRSYPTFGDLLAAVLVYFGRLSSAEQPPGQLPGQQQQQQQTVVRESKAKNM